MNKQTKKKYKLKVDFDFNPELFIIWFITSIGLAIAICLAIFIIKSNIQHGLDGSIAVLLPISVLFIICVVAHIIVFDNTFDFYREEVKLPLTEEEKQAIEEENRQFKLRQEESERKSALSAHDWLMERYPTEDDLPEDTTYQDLEKIIISADKDYLHQYGTDKAVNWCFNRNVHRLHTLETRLSVWSAFVAKQKAKQQATQRYEDEIQQYETRYGVKFDEHLGE